MKKLIIDIEESHQLNIHYGLGVVKTLGLRDDFIYGTLLPSVLLMDNQHSKIIIDDTITRAIDPLIRNTVIQRNSVIHHYKETLIHSVIIPLYETIIGFISRCKIPLTRINSVNVTDKGFGILVSINVED